MTATAAPLEIVRIGDGDVEVEVLPEAGARLHRVRAFGADVLRAPDDPRHHLADPWFWGGYVMAPWCNRVAPGLMELAGRAIDLRANFFDGTAIHGQVMVSPWRHEGDGTFRIEGGGRGTGWPWPFAVEERVRVDGANLTVELRLINRSDAPMPGGLGLHPWFRKPVRIAIGGRQVLPTNVGSPPEPLPVFERFDRRQLESLPDGLDATWTDLVDPPVVLEWPEAGVRATMAVDAPAVFIVAASPADKDAVAVEPQTHAPDGIRRLVNREPGALRLIAPGDTLSLTMALAFQQLGVHELQT